LVSAGATGHDFCPFTHDIAPLPEIEIPDGRLKPPAAPLAAVDQ
jgi:hypothetical protein